MNHSTIKIAPILSIAAIALLACMGRTQALAQGPSQPNAAQHAQATPLPLSALSGALNPVEAMPKWLQPLTVLNPVHHFATIVRGSTLKGSGFMDLWPNFLGLLIFTIVLVSISITRFREQLS